MLPVHQSGGSDKRFFQIYDATPRVFMGKKDKMCRWKRTSGSLLGGDSQLAKAHVRLSPCYLVRSLDHKVLDVGLFRRDVLLAIIPKGSKAAAWAYVPPERETTIILSGRTSAAVRQLLSLLHVSWVWVPSNLQPVSFSHCID